jgi:hypothetical protein
VFTEALAKEDMLRRVLPETPEGEFLLAGPPLVQAELATMAWFGIRLGPSTLRHL